MPATRKRQQNSQSVDAATSQRPKRARKNPEASSSSYIATQVDELGNDSHAPANLKASSSSNIFADNAGSSKQRHQALEQAPAHPSDDDDENLDEYDSEPRRDDVEVVDNPAFKNIPYIHGQSVVDRSQTTPEILAALHRDELEQLVLPAYRKFCKQQQGTYRLAHWILQGDDYHGKAFRHGLLPDADTLRIMGEANKRDKERQAARMKASGLVWKDGDWVCEDDDY